MAKAQRDISSEAGNPVVISSALDDVNVPAEIGELLIPLEQIHAVPAFDVHFDRFKEQAADIEKRLKHRRRPTPFR